MNESLEETLEDIIKELEEKKDSAPEYYIEFLTKYKKSIDFFTWA